MIYYLKTFNHLHGSKKFFKNHTDMAKHVKEIVSKCKGSLSDTQLESSLFILSIDENLLPEYMQLFRVTYKIKPPWEETQEETKKKDDEEQEEECLTKWKEKLKLMLDKQYPMTNKED